MDVLYPPACIACQDPADQLNGLCPACWGNAPFIQDPSCEACGCQLVGEADDPTDILFCDECMTDHPPWDRGRAVFRYHGVARDLVLGLKHADRHDLVVPFAGWAKSKIEHLVTPQTVFVPVPLHFWRLIKRRYNQSAVIANELADQFGCPSIPDALIRVRSTPSLDGRTRDERFETLQGAIAPNPKRSTQIKHKDVILVDDVMTSGATFTTCTLALRAQGAASVTVLALARVGKHD